MCRIQKQKQQVQKQQSWAHPQRGAGTGSHFRSRLRHPTKNKQSGRDKVKFPVKRKLPGQIRGNLDKPGDSWDSEHLVTSVLVISVVHRNDGSVCRACCGCHVRQQFKTFWPEMTKSLSLCVCVCVCVRVYVVINWKKIDFFAFDTKFRTWC